VKIPKGFDSEQTTPQSCLHSEHQWHKNIRHLPRFDRTDQTYEATLTVLMRLTTRRRRKPKCLIYAQPINNAMRIHRPATRKEPRRRSMLFFRIRKTGSDQIRFGGSPVGEQFQKNQWNFRHERELQIDDPGGKSLIRGAWTDRIHRRKNHFFRYTNRCSTRFLPYCRTTYNNFRTKLA
jgi:hypothetical protein